MRNRLSGGRFENDWSTEYLCARVELGQNGGIPQGSARGRRGLPLEDLFEVMENTALLEGSREEFLEALDALKGLAASGEIQVDPGELEALDEELRWGGLTPHHHSDAYQEEYHPAYEIVGGEFIEGLIE